MKYILFFIMLFTHVVFAQSVMSSEDAIKIGLKNNFEIKIARNSDIISQNNEGKGTAEFLPSLNASGYYQLLNSDPETNSPFSFGASDTRTYGADLTLSWTLFDGLKMFAEKERYNELAKLGEAQTRNLIESTIVAILRSYFNLVQQELLLDVAINTLEISEVRLNREKTRREVGGSSSTDLLNAQVSYNSDKSQFLNQELGVLIARKELNLLLGREADTEILVKKEIEIPELLFSQEELIDLTNKNNANLKVVLYNKSVADLNINLVNSVYYPTLTLNSSYSYSDRSVSSSSPQFRDGILTKSRDAAVGLTLSFNLFNGFRNKIDSQNAQIEAENSELQLQNLILQLDGLVKEKYQTYLQRLELVDLEKQNTEAALQNLSLQQDRYDLGTTNFLEFRDAQINLARAQTAYISSQYLTRISHFEIEQLIGKISI